LTNQQKAKLIVTTNDSKLHQVINNHQDTVIQFCKLSNLEVKCNPSGESALEPTGTRIISDKCKIFVSAEGAVEYQTEILKLNKQHQMLINAKNVLLRQINDPNFEKKKSPTINPREAKAKISNNC